MTSSSFPQWIRTAASAPPKPKKAMNTTVLSFTKSLSIIPIQIFHSAQIRYLQPLNICHIKSSNSSNDGENTSPTVPPPPPVTPPNTVEIRFRRGSRRRSKQQQQQKKDGVTNGMPTKASTPKDWEAMTLTEKAIELYVGEKGILFWLNKLSYASIFVVIGAWILFRFVGPALNLYQLDAPPVSPTTMFKGS